MIRYLYCKTKGIEFIYGSALGIVDAFIDFAVALVLGALIVWALL